MGKLIYAAIASLDGYVEDEEGRFDWSKPDEEVHAFVNDLERPRSRHLKVLRDAGLVEVRRDAQRRLYRLRAEPLRELDEWLEPYRAELARRLDSLEHHLERTAPPVSPNPISPKEQPR